MPARLKLQVIIIYPMRKFRRFFAEEPHATIFQPQLLLLEELFVNASERSMAEPALRERLDEIERLKL